MSMKTAVMKNGKGLAGKLPGNTPTKKPIPLATKDKIRVLHDKGWSSARIQKRYRNYSLRQIGAVRGWMRRGAY